MNPSTTAVQVVLQFLWGHSSKPEVGLLTDYARYRADLWRFE